MRIDHPLIGFLASFAIVGGILLVTQSGKKPPTPPPLAIDSPFLTPPLPGEETRVRETPKKKKSLLEVLGSKSSDNRKQIESSVLRGEVGSVIRAYMDAGPGYEEIVKNSIRQMRKNPEHFFDEIDQALVNLPSHMGIERQILLRLSSELPVDRRKKLDLLSRELESTQFERDAIRTQAVSRAYKIGIEPTRVSETLIKRIDSSEFSSDEKAKILREIALYDPIRALKASERMGLNLGGQK